MSALLALLRGQKKDGSEAPAHDFVTQPQATPIGLFSHAGSHMIYKDEVVNRLPHCTL